MPQFLVIQLCNKLLLMWWEHGHNKNTEGLGCIKQP